ncbi:MULTISPECIES: hemin uptake protein HemP [Winslowiella]|uniref:hemin uptake protein HemP n=1 Tax=Winslowiella TaxID=2997349 RepID=UPI0028BEE52F|nr:hemin uptake protein HemP [Winslowiella toletana]WNN46254.1 hemin uptake protein HemP [Winslowiella toletana]
MDKSPSTCAIPETGHSLRQVDSKLLLGSEGRVVILHQGQQYILRQTQAGKLILTK